MYLNYYMLGILVLPGIILAIYAEIKVENTFNKYNNLIAQCGMTASQVARMFLDNAGLSDIQVIRVSGHLTDHYHHRKKIIALSESVYDSNSISAIGIACHEVGHAIQHKTKYTPIMIRNLIIHMSNISSRMLWPLIIVGVIFYYTPLGSVLLWVGIGTFALSVLLNLITLPVEYNASKRASSLLLNSTVLNEDEVHGVKQVLNSAALTYVASLVVSLLNLLRLILALFINNRD